VKADEARKEQTWSNADTSKRSAAALKRQRQKEYAASLRQRNRNSKQRQRRQQQHTEHSSACATGAASPSSVNGRMYHSPSGTDMEMTASMSDAADRSADRIRGAASAALETLSPPSQCLSDLSPVVSAVAPSTTESAASLDFRERFSPNETNGGSEMRDVDRSMERIMRAAAGARERLGVSFG
jgi:hypothetical protein